MRVLTIVHGFPGPGDPATGIFVLKQLQALRDLGFQAHVMRFAPLAPPVGRWKRYQLPSHYRVEGFDVAVWRGLLGPRFRFLRYLGLQAKPFLKRLIRRFQPDVIHAHQLIPTAPLGVSLGVPLVVTAHGSDAYDYPFRNAETRHVAESVVRAAYKVVAVSGFIARKIEELGGQAAVVFNGADESIFVPGNREQARRELGYAEDTPVLAFVGAVEESKGVRDFVLSLRRVQDLRPVVFIAGYGGLMGYVAFELSRLSIQHHILGIVPQHTLRRVFQASSAVVLPSYREGLPAVVCEAMMAGRVVITTPVGGIPEVVTHASTGIIVPTGAVDALGNAIRMVIENHELRTSIEQNARAFALANLTWRRNATAYGEIFQSVLR